MNNAIGSKGGRNDRRRTLLITKAKKKKLRSYYEQEKLKKLQKKVFWLETSTLVKVLPLALTGQVFKTIINNTKKDKVKKSLEENIILKEIKTTTVEEKKEAKSTIKNNEIKPLLETKKEEVTLKEEVKSIDIKELPKKEIKEVKKVEKKETVEEPKISAKEEKKPKEKEDLYLDSNSKGFFQEETKKIIPQENLSNHRPLNNENNYLTKEVLEEPERKKVSSSKEDSEELELPPLEDLTAAFSPEEPEDLNRNQEPLDIDLSTLKAKYYNYENVIKDIISFQEEQELLLKEVKEKVKNALTIQEKVKVEVEAMDKQSKKLFRFLSLQMFLPGAKSAKSLALFASTYLYFINNIIKPKTTTKKYQVVKVKDYSEEIKKNLNSVDNTLLSLTNTKTQVVKTINDIKREYADYLELEECSSLIKNLERLKKNLDNKELELYSLSKIERDTLEKNNAKVLKYTKY